MRYLTIVRHAKAIPAGLGIDDRTRVLAERGRRQCEGLRAWALDPAGGAPFGPVTALVSAATRTRETFSRSFAGTPFVARVEESSLIYNGVRDVSAEDVLTDLAAIDPVTTSLLVVGHNPWVHELALTLADDPPRELRERFPTAQAVVLTLADDHPVGRERYPVASVVRPDGR